MPRPAKVWWNKQKQAWFTELGGARRMLAKGKSNKSLAKEKLQALLEEQALLVQVNGAITVAALCDAFLEDALHNLEPRTYESYRYGCQKFADLFAARAAHTIEPQDISQFARVIKKSLNPTSQAIAAIRIDFDNWLRSLNPRDRSMAETLAVGESTGRVARMFDVTAGRVSQLRQELHDSWCKFTGDAPPRKMSLARSFARRSMGVASCHRVLVTPSFLILFVAPLKWLQYSLTFEERRLHAD